MNTMALPHTHHPTGPTLADVTDAVPRCRSTSDMDFNVSAHSYQNFVIKWMRFGTVNVIFVKIDTAKATLYRTMKIFCHTFYPTGIKIGKEMSTNIYRVTERFVKTGAVKVALHLRACYPHCSILVKFGATDLHTLLLIIREFRQNRRR
jgi:hypothetical protein